VRLEIRVAREPKELPRCWSSPSWPSQVTFGLAPLRSGWRAFYSDGDEVLVPTHSTSKCALVKPRICRLDAGQLHRSAAIRAGRMRKQREVLRQHLASPSRRRTQSHCHRRLQAKVSADDKLTSQTLSVSKHIGRDFSPMRVVPAGTNVPY
jgi:hypothetical protein